MSKSDVQTIEALTESCLKAMGPEKGIAILSSVICQLYKETDQRNAMVLTQPAEQVIVITTTLDAVDQIPRIIQKTLEQLPEVLKKAIEAGDVEGVKQVDGDTGELKGKPDPSKLH